MGRLRPVAVVEDALDLREEQHADLEDARILRAARVEGTSRGVGVPEQQAADHARSDHGDRPPRRLDLPAGSGEPGAAACAWTQASSAFATWALRRSSDGSKAARARS